MIQIKEILRRFIPLLLASYGTFLIIFPGGKHIVADLYDMQGAFNKYQADHEAVINYDTYISTEFKGQYVYVDGKVWQQLYDQIKTQSPALSQNRSAGGSGSYIFSVGNSPFDELDIYSNDRNLVQIGNNQWLSVKVHFINDIYEPPAKFIHPHFYLGIILICVAFIIYFALPRYKFSEHAIHYAGSSAVVLPDMIGLFLTPFFFNIPFLVVFENAPHSSIFSFSAGWIWLTIAFWLLAFISHFMLRVGYFYSTLYINIEDSGLVISQHDKKKILNWKELQSFCSYESRTSSKIARLLIIFGGSFSAIGLGIVMDGNNETGLLIKDRNDKSTKIMANSLKRFDEITTALKENGIPRTKKVIK